MTFGKSQGVLSGPKGGEPMRQIFFSLTPEMVEYIDETVQGNPFSGSNYVDFDVTNYLDMLPEVEAEIFFMLCVKKKNQKDVAKILGMSQPTVSYRYRRTLDKLAYLLLLRSVDLKKVLSTVPQLNQKEKDILHDLFHTANQEMVGNKFGVRQSSVKWIFMKAKRYLEAHERKDPEMWFRQYALFLLLEKNLRIRIFC